MLENPAPPPRTSPATLTAPAAETQHPVSGSPPIAVESATVRPVGGVPGLAFPQALLGSTGYGSP
nr:hypothetical protein JVH1_0727 [Rhodococcus sp. JVH1]